MGVDQDGKRKKNPTQHGKSLNIQRDGVAVFNESKMSSNWGLVLL